MSRQAGRAASKERSDSAVISVRLDAGARRRLARLAKSTDRTASWLVQDAVAAYLDAEEWQVEATAAAVRHADASPAQGVSGARVRAWVGSWGSKAEARRPR